jgi:hypothetical protein
VDGLLELEVMAAKNGDSGSCLMGEYRKIELTPAKP